MRKIIVIIVCLLFVKVGYSLNPNESNSSLLLASNDNNKSELVLNNNYQQFKLQVVNLETEDYTNFSYIRRRRNKHDHLMLYVAGGLALATATLILTNDPNNFTSNSASGVNLGIAVGGTLACGMIVAKYFIDRKR